MDGKVGKKQEKRRGDGIEEADSDGRTILKSFVRYPLSETLLLGTMAY